MGRSVRGWSASGLVYSRLHAAGLQRSQLLQRWHGGHALCGEHTVTLQLPVLVLVLVLFQHIAPTRWVIAASLGGMPTTRVRPWKTGLLSAPLRSPETCRRNRMNLSSSPKGFCEAVGGGTVGDRHGGAAAQGRAARRPGRRALRQRQAGRRAAVGAPAPAGAD